MRWGRYQKTASSVDAKVPRHFLASNGVRLLRQKHTKHLQNALHQPVESPIQALKSRLSRNSATPLSKVQTILLLVHTRATMYQTRRCDRMIRLLVLQYPDPSQKAFPCD